MYRGNPEPSSRQVVLDFLSCAFKQKQVRQAFDRFVSDAYVEHEPGVPAGVDAVIQHLEDVQARFPGLTYEPRHVAADGYLVFVHSRVATANVDPGMAVVDIFRVEHGKLVEHWDVIEPLHLAW